MSDYEAYAARHQKLEEIREKYFKKDEEEDDVDYFQKKRIERDAMRERQREAELAYHNREKDLRSALGYSVWADKKDDELKKKIEANRSFDARKAEEEIQKRREERELRKEDRRAMAKREEEMASIKARWEMEDRARAIAQAEDENHQRGQEWRRREAKLDAIKRERERYREERRLREEERAVQGHIREREWKMKQDQEALDAKEWAKKQEDRKKQQDRASRKAAIGGYESYNSGLTFCALHSDQEDPYADMLFRETDRRRKNWEGHKRRLGASEQQYEEMKKWYAERDLDRLERSHRASAF